MRWLADTPVAPRFGAALNPPTTTGDTKLYEFVTRFVAVPLTASNGIMPIKNMTTNTRKRQRLRLHKRNREGLVKRQKDHFWD